MSTQAKGLAMARGPMLLALCLAMVAGIILVLLRQPPDTNLPLDARSNTSGSARDQIRIVGSSTVAPFAAAAAEEFGRTTRFKTPIVEQTGTGGGMKLFCSGLGPQYPDVTNASRRIKISEFNQCRENGVLDIIEVRIGYDGIVLANANGGPSFQLRLSELFLALGAYVPVDGQLVENPYERWSDIRSDLPDMPIEVLGPPPTSGTRDAFNELGLDPGAEQLDRPVAVTTGLPARCVDTIATCDADRIWIKTRDTTDAYVDLRTDRFETMAAFHRGLPDIFPSVSQFVREDGKFIEAGESDNLIVQKLLANPQAVGVFGYSNLDQNTDKVKPLPVSQKGGPFVIPSFASIESNDYPISRSLFFYVKRQHMDSVPGIDAYLAEFISEDAAGYYGYLAERGLIPLSPAEQDQVRRAVASRQTLTSLDENS